MISSQAHPLEGRLPTGNMISFALGGAVAPPPQPVMQMEATGAFIKRRDIGVSQQHPQARGQPLAVQDNTGERPRSDTAAANTDLQASHVQYSGFNNAIKKWGLLTKASMARDLKWQHEMDGDAQKITQFKEVIGGLQDFCT